ISRIGGFRFAGMGSDSAGNSKSGREFIFEEIPTIIILPDPSHHLSNTVKDICVLEYFQDAIGKMRAIITFFTKSTFVATHLLAIRVIMTINRGLESVGKMRFATMYWAGYALLQCIPGIFELIR
ncbi:hypothetical protein C8J56DRAFT_712978, partial [Mycena floridula]